MLRALLLNAFILLSSILCGQVELDSIIPIPVEIGPWNGKAYHIVTKINKHYYEEVEGQTPFAEVRYDQLHITDRDTRMGFPQIDKQSSFGLILRSEIIVEKPGTYGFKLSSDDGSKLWIGNTRIIDNDGPHGFKSKANRICLPKGRHPIKIWYYQGWPTRFGLDLECVRIADACLDPLEPLIVDVNQRIQEAKSNKKDLEEVEAFFHEPIPILFDHWKSDILPEFESVIADIRSNIEQLNNVIIRVEGHTDDTGNDELNLNLSRARAEAIMTAIYDAAVKNNNRVQSVGFGADRPIASNIDEEGRRKNRRVEVKIIPMNPGRTIN